MIKPETSYFDLRPCDKQIGSTDPKPGGNKQLNNATANTSIDTGYLQELGLPSLPPLSHLLTDGKTNVATTSASTSLPTLTTDVQAMVEPFFATPNSSSANNTSSATTAPSPVNNALTESCSSTSLSVTPAVVSAMTDSMGIMASGTTSGASTTTTAPLSMLMDPTSCAVAAAMYLPPHQNMMSDSTTTAVAAAALMASNPMLPSANPSSFYSLSHSNANGNNNDTNNTNNNSNNHQNSTACSSLSSSSQSSPSTMSSSPTNNMSDLASSFMVPPNTLDPRDSIEKSYSFVAIPGANQRKRPRRRYDEIERLYHCTWPNCTKSYGTLNHLNAHVSMQKHGPKRHPSEFKEMRKNWRRQKKEREAAKKAAEKDGLTSTMVNAMNASMATGLSSNNTNNNNHVSQHDTSLMQSLQSYNTYAPFPSMYTSLPQTMASVGAFY